MPKKKKYLSGKDLQQALFIRTEGYAANVRTIYQNAFTQIIDIVKGTYLVDGKPFSFSEYGYTDEVQPILRRMYSLTYQTIRGGIQKEWMFAAENNDELVKSIFGEHSISDPHFARYFLRNREAMDAFFARKKEGLNLSQNVWKYTGQFKGELENTLDLAIGEGTPANQLAARVKEYLNDPDRWYRRFRIKIGEDEDGNPIYGRKWKRRIFNQEDGIYQWIDDDPRDYHPGRGVYRSSARNAQRLARTETNIAYRASDYERWAQLDFVVGIEIKVSKNHPDPDICDDLQGKYPKDFKWTGWHPNCRCYMIPVLATEDEAFDIADKLASEDDPGSVHSENTVDDVPEGFKKWIQDPKTQERMEKARERGTLPYWVRDNEKYVAGGAVLKSISNAQHATVQSVPPHIETYKMEGDHVYVSDLNQEAERGENIRLAQFLAEQTGDDVYVLPHIQPTLHDAERLRSEYFPDGVKENKNPDLYFRSRFVDEKSMVNDAPTDRKIAKRKIQNRLRDAFQQADDAYLEIPTSYPRGWVEGAIIGKLNSSPLYHIVYVKYGDELLIIMSKK